MPKGSKKSDCGSGIPAATGGGIGMPLPVPASIAKPMVALLEIALLLLAAALPATAANESPSAVSSAAQADHREPRPHLPDMRFSGRLKATGSLSRPDENSIFEPVGTGTFLDGSAGLRLINETFFSDRLYFEAHYEAILAGGDTRRKLGELEEIFPGLPDNFSLGGRLDDDRRLMDLTDTVRDRDSYRLLHRLDRLNLAMFTDWGALRIGRQAVTWGNGLVFNPMDLFNPFAPTEIDRDYKTGDDLISAQVNLPGATELQLLYVAHRNPQTDDAGFDESSLAGKLHFAAGTTEFDIMASRHYKDFVLGLGSRGYLREAAWRLDATWTVLDDPAHGSPGSYLSLVANMDYSWMWGGKNFYGLVEFYCNGLGDNDYEEAVVNTDIRERIARGELFVLGRYYLSGSLQIELHPLVQFYATVINNVNDPSGIFQPRMLWDISQNLQLTLGANLYYGASGTEFGGFELPGTGLRARPADSVYLWLTYYF